MCAAPVYVAHKPESKGTDRHSMKPNGQTTIEIRATNKAHIYDIYNPRLKRVVMSALDGRRTSSRPSPLEVALGPVWERMHIVPRDVPRAEWQEIAAAHRRGR
jgi:hypothetical protein